MLSRIFSTDDWNTSSRVSSYDSNCVIVAVTFNWAQKSQGLKVKPDLSCPCRWVQSKRCCWLVCQVGGWGRFDKWKYGSCSWIHVTIECSFKVWPTGADCYITRYDAAYTIVISTGAICSASQGFALLVCVAGALQGNSTLSVTRVVVERHHGDQRGEQVHWGWKHNKSMGQISWSSHVSKWRGSIVMVMVRRHSHIYLKHTNIYIYNLRELSMGK